RLYRSQIAMNYKGAWFDTSPRVRLVIVLHTCRSRGNPTAVAYAVRVLSVTCPRVNHSATSRSTGSHHAGGASTFCCSGGVVSRTTSSLMVRTSVETAKGPPRSAAPSRWWGYWRTVTWYIAVAGSNSAAAVGWTQPQRFAASSAA